MADTTLDEDVLDWAGEHLSLVRDDEVGLRAAIAVHDTSLGSGLGGVRLGRYATPTAAAREAQRLASAMTVKNALAGLPYGGAKSVIWSSGPDRVALMRRFGTFVARLGGTYLPGVDMGTGNTDLQSMALGGAVVSCAVTDPSPWTAAGVLAAMRAGREHLTGTADLRNVRVAIQGVGHVGAHLARLCAAEGARLLITDIDPDRTKLLAAELGAVVVAPGELLQTAADVFAPCAAARVLTAEIVGRVGAPLIVGAANDTLADDTVADALLARDICYIPDFLANAGGVIQIHAERSGWDDATLERAISTIGDRTAATLAETPPGCTPLQTAVRMARRIVADGRADDASPRPLSAAAR